VKPFELEEHDTYKVYLASELDYCDNEEDVQFNEGLRYLANEIHNEGDKKFVELYWYVTHEKTEAVEVAIKALEHKFAYFGPECGEQRVTIYASSTCVECGNQELKYFSYCPNCGTPTLPKIRYDIYLNPGGVVEDENKDRTWKMRRI